MNTRLVCTILFTMIIAIAALCLPQEVYAINATTAPTALTAIAQSDKPLNSELGKIIFYWTDASTNEAGFVVHQAPPPGTTYTAVTGSPIASTTTGATGTQYSYTADSLSDNTLYTYRVVAYVSDPAGDTGSWVYTSNTSLDRTKPATSSLGVAEANCVGYWSFDDTTVPGKDYSAYGNNGTNSGATSIAGVSSNALSFNGSNNYVTIPISNNLKVQTTLTLETWIKPDASYVGDILILGQGAYYLTYGSGGSISCYWYGKTPEGYFSTAGGLVATGRWSHVAAVWDGSTVKIYVNGIERLSQTCTGTGSPAVNQVWFGAESNGTTRQFKGLIDEPHIYNRALSASEINAHYSSGLNYVPLSAKPTDSNLVGYWNIDEGSGSYAYDASGSGKTGTITNATFVAGKFNTALSFDGSGDYVSVGTVGGYSNALTVSAWVNHSAAADWDDIVAGGCGDILFGFNSNQLWWGCQCNSPVTGVQYNTNINGAWHHVVGVYDGSTSRLYVDGVEVASGSRSGSFTPGNLTIGGSGASESFTGQIDDVRIYNTALTDQQIYNLYSSGANTYAYYRSATSTGTYSAIKTNPKIVVVEDGNGNRVLTNRLIALGYNVTVNTALTTYSEVSSYDIIVFDQYAWAVTKSALAKDCYDNGKGVLTAGNDTTTGLYPILAVGTYTTPDALTTTGCDFHPTQTSWSSFSGGEGSNSYPTSLVSGAWAIARVAASPTYIGIVGLSEPNKGRWIHIQDYYGYSADDTAMIEFTNWLAKGFNGTIGTDTFGGLSDDFNDGNTNGWTSTGGTWTVSNGVLDGFGAGAGASPFYNLTYDDFSAADIVYECKVKPVTSGASRGKALIFRYQDASNYYLVDFEAWTQNKAEIGKRVAGTWTNLANVPFTFTPNQWYLFKVVMKGNDIEFYIDGTLMARVTDSSITSAGKVGFMIDYDDEHVYYDDVRVTPIGTDKGDSQAPSIPAFYASDATDGSSSHNTSAWQSGISNDNTVDFGWIEPASNGDDYYYYTTAIDSMGNISNIATNGEFERGSGSDAYNWAPIDGSRLSETWVTDSHMGSHAVRTEVILAGESNTDHYYGLTQSYGDPNTTGMVGKTYMATAWVKAAAGVNYHISLWCVYNWSENTYRGYASGTGNGGWQYIQTTTVTPNSGQTNMHVRMSIDTSTLGTQVTWDDYKVIEVVPKTVTTPISGYWWAVNDSTPESGGTWVARTTNSTTTPAVPDGTGNYIYVKAEDGAGNLSAVKTYGPFYIDITQPSSTTVDSISESSAYAYATGTTVYYNTASTGTFTVNASAADATSAIQKINFPALGAFSATNGGDDATSTYSWAYNWATTSTQNGTANVTAYDNANNTRTAGFNVYLDTTAPTAGTISASENSLYIYISGSNIYYSNQMPGTETLTLTVNGVSDSGSGMQYVQFPDILNAGSSWQDTAAPYTKDYSITSATNAAGGATCITKDNTSNNANTNTFQIYRVISENPPTGVSFKTTSVGAAITPSTWQPDRDPYVYWTAPSSSTGIAEYQYKITNIDSGADLVAFTSTGANTYVQIANNTLPSGKWRVYVKARNNVQVWSSWASNDIWVLGDPDVQITYHGSTPATGTWYQGTGEQFSFTSSNLGGGIGYYKYVINASSDNSNSATDPSSGTQWSSGTLQLNIPNSKYIYVHFKAYPTSGTDPGASYIQHFGPYQYVSTSRRLKHNKFFDDNGALTPLTP